MPMSVKRSQSSSYDQRNCAVSCFNKAKAACSANRLRKMVCVSMAFGKSRKELQTSKICDEESIMSCNTLFLNAIWGFTCDVVCPRR